MLLQFLAPAAEVREPVEYSLLRISRRAMATRFEVAIPFGIPHAQDAAEDALDLIDDLEDQLTIYREHSEVSQINANAFGQPVQVEASLFALLNEAATYSQITGGAFDIAAGALIKAWGFHRREGRIPSPGERANALQASGLKHVILNAENRTIRFLRSGLELNLGSIGKGYALDRAASLLCEKWGIHSAMLNAGGSSMLALGTPPGEPRGWEVAIRHPSGVGNVGTLRLENCALGTSAATYQHFEYNGKRYGHVLDPRSGWPVEAVASASAVAPTAAQADAFATAFFVLGSAAAQTLAATRPTLGGVILERDQPVAFGMKPHDYLPPIPA